MTDQEKLQQLFQAALQDSDFSEKPTRAFPSSTAVPAVPAPQVAAPVQAPMPVQEVVQPIFSPVPAPASQAVAPLVQPMKNAGLDEATSTELGALLDAQYARKAKRRRRELVVTLLVCFGLTGGGYGWFIQSPQRVTALQDALRDIKSVGDIKGLVAKYQVALDRIAARSKQIDEATVSMGGDPTQKNLDDIYMEAETEAFTGEKGKSVGARNKMIQEKFGKVLKNQLHVDPALAADPKAAPAPKSVAKTADGNNFE